MALQCRRIEKNQIISLGRAYHTIPCISCKWARWSHKHIHGIAEYAKTEQHTNYVHNFNDIETRNSRKKPPELYVNDAHDLKCCHVSFDGISYVKFEYFGVCFICHTVFRLKRHSAHKTIKHFRMFAEAKIRAEQRKSERERKTTSLAKGWRANKNPNELKKIHKQGGHTKKKKKK